MPGYRHLQHDFGTLEKMVKLLAIYGANPPRVWAKMALQPYANLPNCETEYGECY